MDIDEAVKICEDFGYRVLSDDEQMNIDNATNNIYEARNTIDRILNE